MSDLLESLLPKNSAESKESISQKIEKDLTPKEKEEVLKIQENAKKERESLYKEVTDQNKEEPQSKHSRLLQRTANLKKEFSFLFFYEIQRTVIAQHRE